MSNLDIKQNIFSDELKKHIFQSLGEHAVRKIGINGVAEEPISFEMRDEGVFVGCVVVQMFWGQLHIKLLIVEEGHRNKGYAKKLMEHAFKYGKERGCSFAFVETLSFQAPDFYQKLGFEVEFKRDGYDRDTSFYYLRRDL